MSGKIRELTFLQAINEALRQQMQRDDTVFIMGEDIGKPWEGPFKATLGLEDLFGERRIRQTPISEAAFIGAAVGAALTGLRPIAELMFIDFMGVAFDQILSQMAKLRCSATFRVLLFDIRSHPRVDKRSTLNPLRCQRSTNIIN
jgi:pyruvate/2-oxoglutarate/acetoin dehydrogenase E1 component